MSSSGGGLEFWVIVGGHGVCLNFPVARLCTIISMEVTAVELVTGISVLKVATVGVGTVGVEEEGVGLVSTLTLYLLLVIMSFFFFQGHSS